MQYAFVGRVACRLLGYRRDIAELTSLFPMGIEDTSGTRQEIRQFLNGPLDGNLWMKFRQSTDATTADFLINPRLFDLNVFAAARSFQDVLTAKPSFCCR